MTEEIALKITDDQTIKGNGPVVFIGPNGAGKTRYAIKVAHWNNAELVPALRNIALPPDVPMQSLGQASQELKRKTDRRKSRPWELSNEINLLFSKLMAEDSSAAIKFRDDHISGKTSEPHQTKLMRLKDAWSQLFPGREIDFAGHKPIVKSEYSSTTSEYPAQKMSDGERVALYLAGRVLDCEQSIIIIDEPEVHFHSRLGTRFWNTMENLRKDCRFIYVTHDLSFALSRSNSTFVVIMPNEAPKIVELEDNIPKDLAESLLAAASFSIYAKRIIFCEGVEGPSLDQKLYTSWFNSPDTAVVPVGTGNNVIRCTKAFGKSNLVTELKAEGIIDRDYWPEDQLEKISDLIFPLPVHEVENLFCLEEVFFVIANFLGISDDDATILYDEALLKIKNRFKGNLLKKQITERVKRRCEHEFYGALNSVNLISSADVFADSINLSSWSNSVEDIVDEEKNRLEKALKNNSNLINKYLPGKAFIKEVAQKLGVSVDRYCDIVCTSLASPSSDQIELHSKLEDILSKYLPERSI